ncbi:unnamed protein product [Thlaspi arvense]|uniref:Uncharacterized protein n=1 Tax=Thlaspi arvense TaxID=13288 RepID=A0AAU9T586_THLAR|nr:unnamed protein product [Thlaspi arvense]
MITDKTDLPSLFDLNYTPIKFWLNDDVSANPKTPPIQFNLLQFHSNGEEVLKSMIRFARPKPIIDSLSCDLLQKCYASGAPNGKSKLKTAQALKRKKASMRKGGGGEEAGKGNGRVSDEKQKLYDQCINAPCPFRYLRPKEREREAMREKLGLISKDRQRETEIQRKGGLFTMGVTDEPMRIGTPGLDYISLGIFTEEELPKYKVTVEDGRRLAKEYSRVLMKQHRARRVEQCNLMNMKKAAIEALPENLKMAALEPDSTPFPANRGTATLTPPIEGYLEKIMDAAKKRSTSYPVESNGKSFKATRPRFSEEHHSLKAEEV